MAGNGNLKPHFHGQRIDLRLGELGQLCAGGFALRRKRCGGLLVGVCRLRERRAQRLEGLVAIFHFSQLARHFFAKRDHIGDGLAVLAFQAIEQGEAVFDLRQPLRGGVDALGVVAQRGADIAHSRARRLNLLREPR